MAIVTLNFRATRAAVNIREACADFAGELSATEDLDELNALWRELRKLESYVSAQTDRAAELAERASQRRG